MSTRPKPKTEHLKATQWKPGQSGNPSGRPKKRLLDEILEELLELGDSQEATAIAHTLLAKARKGDVKAVQLVAERTQGRPSQKLEISGPEGGAIPLELGEVDARIAELLKRASDRVSDIGGKAGTLGSAGATGEAAGDQQDR